MDLLLPNFTEIKGGLSKKVYRKFEKNFTKIIIDFSKDRSEFNNFLNVYGILKKVNISIPKLYEVHFNRKLIIMEDFGDNTFDSIFNDNNVYKLLKLAVDNLIVIQNSITNDNLSNLEKYTYSTFEKEISEFVEYFLPYKQISNFPSDVFYNSWKKKF